MNIRSKTPFVLASAALLSVVLPAGAAAPPDQYGEFVGETQTIIDAHTKLQWERRVRAADTFLAAKNFCEVTLGAGNRLPTMKELLTLVDEEPHQEYDNNALVTKMIDRFAFGNSTTQIRSPVDKTYWTSSPKDATENWTVDFSDGRVKGADKAGQKYYRCVRYVP